MRVLSLLEQLGKRLKFPEVKLNANGRCSMKIDGQIVGFAYNSTDQIFTFSSILGQLPEEPEVQRIILHSNTIRWPLDNGKLIAYPNVLKVDPLGYVKTIPVNDVNPEDFCSSVESFLNEIDRWNNALKALKTANEEKAYIVV